MRKRYPQITHQIVWEFLCPRPEHFSLVMPEYRKASQKYNARHLHTYTSHSVFSCLTIPNIRSISSRMQHNSRERERTFLLRKNPSLYNCFVAFSANDNDHAIDYYSKIVSTTGSFHARTIRPTDTTAVTAPPKKQTITRNCRHRVRFDSKQKRKIGFMKLSAIEKIQFPRY